MNSNFCSSENSTLLCGRAAPRLNKRLTALGGLKCEIAAKLGQRMRCSVNAAKSFTLGMGVKPPKCLGTDQIFGLTGEPLYGGQGKTGKLNNNLFHTADMHSEATGDWGSATQAKGICNHIRELHQATTLPAQDSDHTTSDHNLTTIPTWEGLNLPWLVTSGAAVSEQDQDQLHKENKCQPCNLKATGD